MKLKRKTCVFIYIYHKYDSEMLVKVKAENESKCWNWPVLIRVPSKSRMTAATAFFKGFAIDIFNNYYTQIDLY